jgi:hypothetical protein
MLVDLERGVANPTVEQRIGSENRAISVTVGEARRARPPNRRQ